MLAGRNTTGRPLAASDWLAAHHRAKLLERRLFCERLAALRPASVVDLGCATGLWLEELNAVLPAECEFIGLDSDTDALAEAKDRAGAWRRPTRFEEFDLADPDLLPPRADLTLMFNVSPYLPDIDELFARLAERSSHVAIRQYDGAALRFGPMDVEERAVVEQSLRAAISASRQIRHYDLDRLFASIHRSPFEKVDVSFELFERISPFPSAFLDYYTGTLAWTLSLLSDSASAVLREWSDKRAANPAVATYFFEVDLVGVLS